MNKICIVAKNKETYFIKRLIEEVGQDVSLFDPWSDFELPEASLYLARTTSVYRSDLDLLILQGIPAEKVVNPLAALKKFRSKGQQYIWFDEENFPVLPWIPLKGTDLLTVEKFFRLYPEAVVKPLAGQGGWGIEALTWDTFKKWKKKTDGDDDYLLQTLIKNGHEYRYFFIEGEPPVILERSAKTGISANFRKQGDANLAELPEDKLLILSDVAKKSGLFYGAIDLIIKDNELSILEVNAVPGIEQLEKVSGINIIVQLFKALKR